MSIEYIDALNSQDAIKKYAIISLDDLLLDKRNPRFSSSTIIGASREIQQSDIIDYLLQFGRVDDLANSINRNHGLYDEEWISCYKNSNNEIIVLEGNRRITACKILKDESLIPNKLKTLLHIVSVDAKTLPNICSVKAIIYENEQDAQNYIVSKHTNPDVKRWETVEQCNYYYEQFINGMTPFQIASKIGEETKNVQEKIKQFGLFKDVFDVVKIDYPDILIEDINILPLATKFFPPLISKKGKVGIGLFFDKETLRYYSAPERADIYNKILLIIGEAFFVRPKLKGGDSFSRSNSNQHRISTDEIKSKSNVEQLIIDDIRIPGLNDLIQQYKNVGSTIAKEEISCTNDNVKPSATQTDDQGNDDNKNPISRTNGNNSEVSFTSSNDKIPEFFSDIQFKHISKVKHLGLVLVCEEIQRISSYFSGAGYKQFPIASAFLLRSLIEQLLSERLKQVGRYENLVKTNKDGSTRSPELGTLINVFLNDSQNKNLSLFWNDGNLAKEFNKCFSGYGTKDQLDTIIHNPHLIQPDHNFLNSFSKQGLKLVIQQFLNQF